MSNPPAGKLKHISVVKFKSNEQGGLRFKDDFPLSGPLLEAMGPRYKVIGEMAMKRGEIASFNNGIYMYITPLGYWTHIHSSSARREIADRVDMENVSVNYDIASIPFVTYAERVARIAYDAPKSVCIGTWRCIVKMDSEHNLTFQPLGGLIDYTKDSIISIRVSGICIMPVQISYIPMKYTIPVISPAEVVLANVLDQEQLQVLRWIVGNGLVDPVNHPRILYLYGSGGDGKSATINTLIANLKGCISPLSKDYPAKDIETTPEDMDKLISSRFVTYGDVVLKDNQINSGFWRKMTGGDTTKVSSGQGKILTTGIFASNYIWYPGKTMLKRWFTRRTIALVMRSPPEGCSPPPNNYTDDDIYFFVMNCIKTRLSYHDPPISIKIALVTIFGHKVAVATRGIVFSNLATDMGAIAATYSICCAALIDYDTIVDLVGSMSRSLVRECFGTKAINGIVCHIPGTEREAQ
jgi:hypothetical protein